MRLGIRKRGAKTDAFDLSSEAVLFTNRFLTAFEQGVKGRFGERARLATDDQLISEESWNQLTKQLEGVSISTIGYTPAPRRLNFSAAINAKLAELDGAVLLVRAEAYYLGKGAIFARAAIPLLLSAGSAAAGAAGASASGASSYSYSIYGAPPSSDVILVQMFLVHSQTRELLWYGQVVMPQYFKQEQVTEKTATKAVEQIPAGLLAAATK